jgi:hypothetical protein
MADAENRDIAEELYQSAMYAFELIFSRIHPAFEKDRETPPPAICTLSEEEWELSELGLHERIKQYLDFCMSLGVKANDDFLMKFADKGLALLEKCKSDEFAYPQLKRVVDDCHNRIESLEDTSKHSVNRPLSKDAKKILEWLYHHEDRICMLIDMEGVELAPKIKLPSTRKTIARYVKDELIPAGYAYLPKGNKGVAITPKGKMVFE